MRMYIAHIILRLTAIERNRDVFICDAFNVERGADPLRGRVPLSCVEFEVHFRSFNSRPAVIPA